MTDALPFAVLYFLCALFAGGLAVRTIPTRLPASRELFGLTVCIAVWSVFCGLEILASERLHRLLWSQLSYIGIYGSSAFLLRFSVRWLKPRLSGWWLGLLWIVPAVVVLAAFTNSRHGLVWPDFYPSELYPYVWHYEHGPVFWAGAVYQYALVAASAGLVVAGAARRTGIYREQALLVLVGISIAVIGNILYVAGVFPALPLELSPFSLAIGTGFLLAGISHARLLELLPAARHRVVDLMPGGLIVLDPDLRVVDWNEAARRIWRLGASDAIGTPIGQIVPGWHDLVPADPPDALTVAFEQGDEDSVCHHIALELWRLSGRKGRTDGWIALFHDNTELRAAELRLQEANQRLERLNKELLLQAIHDGLTGLFNRAYLDEALPRELARARRSGTNVGMLVMDVDHFKHVNDGLGHDTGDRVLVGVANLVRGMLRAGDVPCRFGGDELVAIMPGASEADTRAVAERIRSRIEEDRFGDPERPIPVTVSIGCAVYPAHADNATDLFRLADQALFAAKDAGRNQVRSVRD